jgi:hypothetical protein
LKQGEAWVKTAELCREHFVLDLNMAPVVPHKSNRSELWKYASYKQRDRIDSLFRRLKGLHRRNGIAKLTTSTWKVAAIESRQDVSRKKSNASSVQVKKRCNGSPLRPIERTR